MSKLSNMNENNNYRLNIDFKKIRKIYFEKIKC